MIRKIISKLLHSVLLHVSNNMNSFIAGFAYGATTVIVGQPFDTVKTLVQTKNHSSSLEVFRSVLHKDGIKGLYRGGFTLLLGGSIIRSTQFGVYEFVLSNMRNHHGSAITDKKLFGLLDIKVIMAGFIGGIGRGLVEGPFELIKTRHQVQSNWQYKDILNGVGATVFRNSFLFSAFVIYMDVGQQIVPGGMSPFWSGAICSNLAWLTIWPLDVIKSQRQSGLYPHQSLTQLIKLNFKNGVFYKGLAPGLIRSFIANGCSMVAYRRVLLLLEDAQKKD